MDTASAYTTRQKRRLSDSDESADSIEPSNKSDKTQTPDAGPSNADVPPLKKLRLDEVNQDESARGDTSKAADDPSTMVVDSAYSSPQTPFVKLPLDVLFEILVQAGSPEYVLAVMRTCKSMFSTLFHSDADWVWKATRKEASYQFGPGQTYHDIPHEFSTWKTSCFTLPEPPSKFFRSEVGYASFIFDGGECTICGKATEHMYKSFALRFRVCKDLGCHRKAPSKLCHSLSPEDEKLAKILPVEETQDLLEVEHYRYTTSEGFRFRSDQLERTRNYFEEIKLHADFETLFAQKQASTTEWMQFCTSIYRWRRAQKHLANHIRLQNRAQAKIYANTYGWDKTDLLDCHPFKSYSKWKSAILETLEDRDVIQMKDDIDAHILALKEKRVRRSNEQTATQNRADIEILYKNLRSKPAYTVLPPLSAFRQLPVVGLLQNTEPPPAPKPTAPIFSGKTEPARPHLLTAVEGNALIAKMIDAQVGVWVDRARDDLAVMLGFPANWKTASKHILHPVDRITARWNCIRCAPLNGEGYATKWRLDECLDFEGVCKHDCGKDGLNVQGRKGKQPRKIEWKASNFQRDDKAIQVIKKWLEMKNLSEETRESVDLFQTSFTVICKSCDPPMILDCRNMIAHSHRHDSMELDANPSIHKLNLFLGGHMYTYGVAEKLLGPSSRSKAIQAEIQKKIYGCRHCMRVKQHQDAKFLEKLDSETVTHAAGSNAPTMFSFEESTRTETGLPLFSFNGLRSHMKGKHSISRIHDEDFYGQRTEFMTA